jgi:hypothetical protein
VLGSDPGAIEVNGKAAMEERFDGELAIVERNSNNSLHFSDLLVGIHVDVVLAWWLFEDSRKRLLGNTLTAV